METQVEVGNIFINDVGKKCRHLLITFAVDEVERLVMRTKILCRKQWMSTKAIRVR